MNVRVTNFFLHKKMNYFKIQSKNFVSLVKKRELIFIFFVIGLTNGVCSVLKNNGKFIFVLLFMFIFFYFFWFFLTFILRKWAFKIVNLSYIVFIFPILINGLTILYSRIIFNMISLLWLLIGGVIYIIKFNKF